ncbi:MAG TPA: ABC transporter permease [Longimicrobiales bacterium]
MHDWSEEIRIRLARAGLRPEDELLVVEELSAHLDDVVRDLTARGVSLDDARARALDELADGDFARLVASARAAAVPPIPIGSQRGGGISGVLFDLRLGARMLRRNPVFAVLSIVTIALALAANATIYSALRSLMLKPLPYEDPDNLAFVQLTSPRESEARIDTLTRWSWPKYEVLHRTQRAYAALAGFSTQDVAIFNGGTAERAAIELATPSYFPVLGISPATGRLFDATRDPRGDGSPVAVISHAMWLERFGGDASVLGRTLDVNRQPFTIIGVAPPGFAGLSGSAVAWIPIAHANTLVYDGVMEETGNHWFKVVARRNASLGAEGERAALSRAYNAVGAATASENGGAIISVPLDSRRVTPAMGRTVMILFGGAALVLLIACANIASLLVARSTAREQEVAVRLALGAGRMRLVRQLLAESMVLATAGGVAGILLAQAGTRALRAMTPALLASGGADLLTLEPARIDVGVLLFTLAAIVVTGVVAGLLPALRASRTDLNGALRDGTTAAGHGRSSARARSVLVVVQTAVAVVLLVGAGLLLRTFLHTRAIPTGVEPSHVVTMRLAPLESDGYTAGRAVQLYTDVTNRIDAIPGVTATSVDRCLPLSGACSTTVATGAGAQSFELDKAPEVDIHFVLPGHLDALGLVLKRGRMLTDADRDGTSKVVLLSESAARHLFGNADPLGQRMKLATAYLRDDASAEVVGIVSDVRYDGVTDPPGRSVYAPALQMASRSMYVFVRTTGNPADLAPAIRAAVQEAAPGVPVTTLQTMKHHFADVLARTRLMTLLLGGFAVFALTLAMVGVFGVITFNVEQRRAEIGLRLALGAQPHAVAARIALHGLAWFGIGITVGIPAAFAASRMLQGLLYDIAPTDVTTYACVLVTLAAAGLAGAWLPSRRAASVDPCCTLRSQ